MTTRRKSGEFSVISHQAAAFQTRWRHMEEVTVPTEQWPDISRLAAAASDAQTLHIMSPTDQNKASASKDLFIKSNYMTSIKEMLRDITDAQT